MAVHGIIAVITFVEAWINTPWEPIPEPTSGDNEKKEDDTPAPVDESEIIYRFRQVSRHV